MKKARKTGPKQPAWMDLIPKNLAKLDELERHAAADKLEATAATLRGFKPKRVEFLPTPVQLRVRPNMKKALVVFAENFGADKTCSDDDKASCGARWALESAMAHVSQVVGWANNQARYRKAEDLEDSEYCERLIAQSLEKWLSETTLADDEEDDD